MAFSFFILASFGVCLSLKRWAGLALETTLILTISLETCLLFLLALGQELSLGFYLVNVLGCLLLLVHLSQFILKPSFHWPKNLTPQFIFWGLFLMYAIVLIGTHFTHYDNFSHWARIVKFLTLEGRLVQEGDSFISFTSYPPGSALYLSYWMQGLPLRDDLMLIGQNLINFACVWPLVGLVKGSQAKQHLASGMALVFIGILNLLDYGAGKILYTSLLVDFLLPLLALAAVTSLYRHRQNFGQLSFITAVMTSFLILIKNSGIFFVLLIIGYYAYLVWTKHRSRFKVGLLAGACPLLTLSLWNQYVSQTFSQVSKHSMNLASYEKILGEKSLADIQAISSRFLQHFLKEDLPSNQALYLFLALCLAGFLLNHFAQAKRAKVSQGLAIMLGILLAYILSLYAMYLFSMPLNEALRLASIHRYMGSILCFLYGLLCLGLLVVWDHRLEPLPKRPLQALTLLLALLTLASHSYKLSQVYHWDDQIVAETVAVVGQETHYHDGNYLLVDDRQDTTYLQLMISYYFYCDQTKIKRPYDYPEQVTPFIQSVEEADAMIYLTNLDQFAKKFTAIYGFSPQPQIYSRQELIQARQAS
ncbi:MULTISPECIES: hypothetical protein [Aerococcus]|uniref:Glycosyltransferase RgtA/B/C/D-like domain-containing protein n=1 Tax=Aerococcus sanguinicola TaxID=119206 RepID=A0A5N1GHW7_9LACT|nr:MULTISPECIES: hypothetical protein [Aerococcus]KAA9300547.1 hypothetical protein F6I03_06995 [Aerococcus sanguinicola]MDK6369656.1 hypothetical protein [Aerococcus sp. UMB9870]MDK6680161.1 hypothetical protein [Aerococcus sp. UMB8608]MDK6686322.1 hypothetical protein [Aerococcus sp. UMB8623]MDK6940242.1 hypothetical protein [Aerococcus sp. UMB8487]